MVPIYSSSEILIVISNGTTAIAYYWLTAQLLTFALDSEITKITLSLLTSKDMQKRKLFYMLLAIATLFASFIMLCGTTHTLSVIKHFYPSNGKVQEAQLIMLILCAVVSVITAIIAFHIFPVILDNIHKFELNSEGDLQHAENYLIDIVELVKESIIVLSEDLKIVRCNEASKIMLGTLAAIDRKYTDFIHPDDVSIFHIAVNRVMDSYNQTQTTIEYRILSLPPPAVKQNQYARASPNRRKQGANYKVFADTEKANSDYITDIEAGNAGVPMTPLPITALRVPSPSPSNSTISTNDDSVQYIWVETTLCKGISLNHGEDFDYDIKLVTRNIEDRKKMAIDQYNSLIQVNEERARTNAAKLRYISCVAHDLKTPLTSFCFTLDLLSQTHMHPEQREFVQQANVAVDLMKLTISQTMDISKALTGAKLMPRRTTVHLSSTMNRVEIIINGFGKEVPVTIEIAADVNDRVITDEEWLWQMILNFLTNACKYTDRGDIKVQVSLQPVAFQTLVATATPRTSLAQQMMLVEVIDTGVGVPDEKLEHMFEAFSQVQEGQVTGTGLGLFGVRTRAEGLNGTCGARHNTASSTGTGTVMWFAIPYVPDISCESPGRTRGVAYKQVMHVPEFKRQETNTKISKTATPCQEPVSDIEERIRYRKIRAIVVDDTKTVRKLMQKLLLRIGFEEVICYENGSKGLDAMMAEQVDIVFSDVQMPIMTGPEMVRRFRKFEIEAIDSGLRFNRQLVVAVTANGSELGEAVNNGFDEVCPKPLSVQEIYNLVEKYLL